MIRKLIIGLVVAGAGLWQEAYANNVRIEGDVRVKDADVVDDIATVKLTLKWDNSWRDDFNYDAVYLFMKYKVDGKNELWHHAYIEPAGHILSDGYSYTMANSKAGVAGMEKHNEGMFIYRTGNGYGNAEVELQIRWYIKSNPDRTLTKEMFTANSVFLSAMGIEMVYIPRGGFRIGDTDSEQTFKNGDVLFPESKNLLVGDAVTEVSSSRPVASNPPAFALNRMNDVAANNSNAWEGCETRAADVVNFVDYLKVSLKDEATVRSFAIESIEGGTPTQWQLQAYITNQWVSIYPKKNDATAMAGPEDWAVGSRQTYPCTRTLRTDPTFNEKCRDYRVAILETANKPVIKNLMMSTADILAEVDNSVLVFDQTSQLSPRFGLYADDEDTWTGTTDGNYPNGYREFYAMKYEVSQEQYVTFLNKLTAPQQRTRSIGSTDLKALQEGQYLFGASKTAVTARNGIKLATKGENDQPYVFTNDLEPGTDYGQDGDGQTIACNFLNAGDMKAYADWCGLRPLTEMEYEKMARRPYPEPAMRGEYAWNMNTAASFDAALKVEATSKGKKDEMVSNGNVNATKKIEGPVRCGVFARAGSNQQNAGASFWGVMELSGNLSEIYYNANSEGRLFRGIARVQHGDGKVDVNGKSDVGDNYWPEVGKAFTLRGGSFEDDAVRTRISDRYRHNNVYANTSELNGVKDSTTTFRLGWTAPALRKYADVMLQNKQTSAMAAIDSVCSGSDYDITGTLPADITGAYHIAWFVSSDNGGNWNLIEGEEEPSLHIANMRNENSREDIFRAYLYKRYIYTNSYDYVQHNVVRLRVINKTLQISRLRDTVDVFDRSKGVRVQAPQTSAFRWTWLRDNVNTPISVEYVLKAGKIQKHFFQYTDFFDGSQFEGEQRVQLAVTVMNRCTSYDTVKVFVVKKPEERNNFDNRIKAHNAEFRCGDILIDNEEPVAIKKRYRTVEIGGRCWFAENLRRTQSGNTYLGNFACYNDNPANCNVYGVLYNWVAATQNSATEGVKGICPTGWHLPTDAEWKTLLTAVGTSVNAENNGRKLKSPLNYWTNLANESTIGSNETGFDALPGGGYFWTWNGVEYGTYADLNIKPAYLYANNYAFWWTSTSEVHNWTTISYGHSSYNSATMPFYVRYDHTTNTFINNVRTDWGTYGYLNSVFCSSTHAHLANSYNSDGVDSGYNGTARNSMRNNFYFSVRCIKN